MKNKTNIVVLKIFSVVLGLYFLNISVNLYSFFDIQTQMAIVEKTADQSACLVQTGFDTGDAPTNNGTNTNNNPPAEEEEEEVKKAAYDDFFTLYNRYTKLADETYLQRFHGINLTGEFISEIIPPPPKA